MKKSSLPFVGLHAHSVAGSIFDAIGYPPEHMDFAYENGAGALALPDHGNMNGLAYKILHSKKMQEEGKEFKPIFGVEAYFLPSIKKWRKELEKVREGCESHMNQLDNDGYCTESDDYVVALAFFEDYLEELRSQDNFVDKVTGLLKDKWEKRKR